MSGMADPSVYEYPSPLEGWRDLPGLPSEKAPDGKSYINPPSNFPSPSYTSFTSPISHGQEGGFDVHIYFLQTEPSQVTFAKELWERVRREFPELRIYSVVERPIGPHPIGMFEVNIFTPAQFGAFVPWLVINRGPLSALLHPNTEEAERDHTQRATWMGQPLPLNLGLFKESKQIMAEREAAGKAAKEQ